MNNGVNTALPEKWPPGTTPHQIPPGFDKHDVTIPPWRHTEWEDEGPRRQQTRFPVRDGTMDILRPAMRLSDISENPTEYACRFGIFPGRNDGRSCTSPTRSSSRRMVFPDGITRSGQDVFEFFESLAQAAQAADMESIMVRNRVDRMASTSLGEAFVNAYEDLTVDEFWQGILFGDKTMDELQAGGHFSMGPAPSKLNGLQGPLYPLFNRSRWSLDAFGYHSAYPQITYVDENEFSMSLEVALEDKLWEALQPALQFATRLLQTKEPFIDAVQDVRKWCFVDPDLDTRTTDEKAKVSWIRVCRDPPIRKTIIHSLPVAPSPELDPVAMTWKVLEKDLTMRLSSAFWLSGWFQPTPIQGSAWAPHESNLGNPIIISIAMEIAFPMLTDKYSESEKMTASYILGTTITHEIIHALEMATRKWLINPREYGITNPQDIEFCRAFRAKIWPTLQTTVLQPFWEDDPVAELGHSYESHVMGGGCWPMQAVPGRLTPMFLRTCSVIGARVKWPTIYHYNERQSLSNKSMLSPNVFSVHSKLEDVSKQFTEDFWRTSVQKYGMAAVRDRGNTLSKVLYHTEGFRLMEHQVKVMTFGSEKEWESISKYAFDLEGQGNTTLAYYFRLLVADACQFDLLLQSFVIDAEAWRQRDKAVNRHMAHAIMILAEAACYVAQNNENIVEEDRLEWQKADFKVWRDLHQRGFGSPDDSSPPAASSIADFVSHISGPLETFDERLQVKLIDYCCCLQDERNRQEAMVAELYRLPAAYWPHYTDGLPGHRGLWMARVVRYSTEIRQVIAKMMLLEPHMPSWRREWEAKLLSYASAFDTILELITKDSTEVHKDWRNMLQTVPLLRNSRRQPYERLYFLAKKEMMKMTGSELAKLTDFTTRFTHLLHLDSKIPWPGSPASWLAERWAGLLEASVSPMQRIPWRLVLSGQYPGAPGPAHPGFLQEREQVRQQAREKDLARVQAAAKKFKLTLGGPLGDSVLAGETRTARGLTIMRGGPIPPQASVATGSHAGTVGSSQNNGGPSSVHGSLDPGPYNGPMPGSVSAPGPLPGPSPQTGPLPPNTPGVGSSQPQQQGQKRSSRRRHRNRRRQRPQHRQMGDTQDEEDDLVMPEPQIVQPLFSSNVATLSQPSLPTGGTSSHDRGLSWRETADRISTPFSTPAASSSVTARLVPHQYTISSSAVEDLYHTVVQTLSAQRISGAAPGPPAEASAKKDKEALRAFHQTILDGQEAEDKALQSAATCLPAAKAGAEKAKNEAAGANSQRASRDQPAPGPAQTERGRKRTREQDGDGSTRKRPRRENDVTERQKALRRGGWEYTCKAIRGAFD